MGISPWLPKDPEKDECPWDSMYEGYIGHTLQLKYADGTTKFFIFDTDTNWKDATFYRIFN